MFRQGGISWQLQAHPRLTTLKLSVYPSANSDLDNPQKCSGTPEFAGGGGGGWLGCGLGVGLGLVHGEFRVESGLVRV